MAVEKATWVDGPLKLIPIPSTYKDANSHYAVTVASEMANAHNCFIRGLNAILIQGPHIPCYGEAGYNARDVQDLLYFMQAWHSLLHHHHAVEEEVLFPGVEKLLGQPGSMDIAIGEQQQFHDGLEALGKYTTEMQETPEEYTWQQLHAIIDTVSVPLVKHLEAEIPLMLSLDRVDEAGLKEVMAATEKAAKESGGLSMLIDGFPMVMGCCDRTQAGAESFPPLPSVLVYAIAYVLSWKHRGAWRFNPSDLFCRPRPLQMIGNRHL